MAKEPIFDENNNSGVDLNSKCGFIEEVRDDVSNASETASGNTCSVSTNSVPPEDPERQNEKVEEEEIQDSPSTEVLLQCKVKKLEAEVDSLKSQLSRFSISESRNVGESTEDRSKQEREKCVVFKCIPQAHVANGLMITRISEFFKIPADELSIQVTDQLNKWCVVVLHTPSKRDSTTILKKFSDFRKLYHCYHRTQALPCFSNAERQRYQQLWAEAIERNNREGFRHWEVDPQELGLVETVGVRQKWRVKVHYYPDSDSPTASTSAIEVRRRQRGQQSPKIEKEEIQESGEKSRKKIRGKRTSQRSPRHSHLSNQQFGCERYELPHHYVPHYVAPFPGCHNYYFPQGIYNGVSFYSQPVPNDIESPLVITSNGLNAAI